MLRVVEGAVLLLEEGDQSCEHRWKKAAGELALVDQGGTSLALMGLLMESWECSCGRVELHLRSRDDLLAWMREAAW